MMMAMIIVMTMMMKNLILGVISNIFCFVLFCAVLYLFSFG